MSKFGKPRAKKMRRVQADLSLFSGVRPTDSKCKIHTRPGVHGAKRTRSSDYGNKLRGKQHILLFYGIKNKQLLADHKEAIRQMRALRQKGKEADYSLLIALESRLCSVVFRLGFAPTMRAARQLIRHGKVFLKNELAQLRRESTPRFDKLTPGSVIEVHVEETQKANIEASLDMASKNAASYPWINAKTEVTSVKKGEKTIYVFTGTFLRSPNQDELPADLLLKQIDVIQFYSK